MGTQLHSVVPYIHFYDVWSLRQLAGYELQLPAELRDDEEDEADLELVEEESPVDDEKELLFLRSLDPKDWKEQDHYAVLGIKKMRWQATEKDIKIAYRRMVLKHHPDKRKARGEVVADESTDYFTCITRAWETLGVRDRRRAYDSVDPKFDESVPSVSDANRANFFTVFGPAFASNSRWSRRQPVPQLGEDKDPRDSVEDFYSFWYEFDSWREFSYLDEEDKEKGENREERRWIERQNREARMRRRKDEAKRLRSLVDNARECDPRLARFRAEETAAKERMKQAKVEAAQRKRAEAEAVRAEAEATRKAAADAAEAAARAEAERQRKDREAVKRALKEARKALRALTKSRSFFLATGDGEAARVSRMEAVELLADGLDADELARLRADLEAAAANAEAGAVLDRAAAGLRERRRTEAEAALKQQQVLQQQKSAAANGADDFQWSYGQLTALVRAVKLIPAGTSARWEKVADYVNSHWDADDPKQQAAPPPVDAKSVLRKAKELAKSASEDSANSAANSLKAEANRQAASRAVAEAAPSDAGSAAGSGGISHRDPACVPTAWSAEEQRALEAALRKFPASDPDRWDRIAAALGTRTKRDCMMRYKELVKMVQAKKTAK